MDKISNALRAARRTRRAQDPNARVETMLAAAAPPAQPASEPQASSVSDSKGDGADAAVDTSRLAVNAESAS